MHSSFGNNLLLEGTIVEDPRGNIGKSSSVLTYFLRQIVELLTCFIATPSDSGWQRNEGLLLLHSFLSLDNGAIVENANVV